MKIANPDDVLWRYLELQRRLGAVPSKPLVGSRGLTFGHQCAQCRADSESACLEEHDTARGASRWICARCGAAWPVNVQFLMRGFHARSRDGRGDMLADLATLRRVLEQLGRHEQIVYLLLTLYENRAPEDAAAEMNRRYRAIRPRHGQRGPRPEEWTPWTVRRCVGDARTQLRIELRERNLLPRPEIGA